MLPWRARLAANWGGDKASGIAGVPSLGVQQSNFFEGVRFANMLAVAPPNYAANGGRTAYKSADQRDPGHGGGL